MQNSEIEAIGKYSAILSIIELGLGSILHAASIPLTGQILSINQIAILSRVSFKEQSNIIGLKISLISSILKSLSPAGKKLTPMLAILAQGLLFSVGLTLFGVNLVGFFFSIALSSAWAFLQPLLLLYLLFGKTLLDVLNYFKKDFTFLSNIEAINIIQLVLFTYFVKLVLAIIISIRLTKMNETEFQSLQKRLNIKTKNKSKKTYDNQLINAFFDLLQPIFIISFILTAFFLYYSQSSVVHIVWSLLRPIALGLFIFYIVRIYPIDKVIKFFDHLGMKNISKSLSVAINYIKKNREL
ncbi:MAG: hypothetical protein Q7U04_07725 [Bacteriovorax sp.]|nr:hypothetical protein [Bacteriovorax sp.]